MGVATQSAVRRPSIPSSTQSSTRKQSAGRRPSTPSSTQSTTRKPPREKKRRSSTPTKMFAPPPTKSTPKVHAKKKNVSSSSKAVSSSKVMAASKQARSPPNGMPEVRKLTGDGRGPMNVHYYKPIGLAARGLVVLAPGSRGGMGPGQVHKGEASTIGLFDPSIRCIYTLLARHLAPQGFAVCHLNWRLCPTRKGAPPGTLKSPVSLLHGAGDIALAARFLRAQHGAELPLVLAGFSFGGPSVMAAGALAVGASPPPSARADGGLVARMVQRAEDEDEVEAEAEDENASHNSASTDSNGEDESASTARSSLASYLGAAAAEVRESARSSLSSSTRSGAVGEPRGGGGGSQAAALIGPLAGVITMGTGLRVGLDGTDAIKQIGDGLVGGASRALPKQYGQLDSEGCVSAFASAGLPLMMIHGLADVTVDPTASQAIFERARGPKAAAWLRGADHHMRARFDDVLSLLQEWIPQLLRHKSDEHLRAPPHVPPAAATKPADDSMARGDTLETEEHIAQAKRHMDENDAEGGSMPRREEAATLTAPLALPAPQSHAATNTPPPRIQGFGIARTL